MIPCPTQAVDTSSLDHCPQMECPLSEVLGTRSVPDFQCFRILECVHTVPSEDVGKEEKKEESREDRLAEARLQLGLRAPLPADGIHLRSRRMSSCFAEVAEPKLQSYDLGMWRAGNRHLSNT